MTALPLVPSRLETETRGQQQDAKNCRFVVRHGWLPKPSWAFAPLKVSTSGNLGHKKRESCAGSRRIQRGPTSTRNRGAIEGTRTPTPLRVHGPEPCASANSATMAKSDWDAATFSRPPSRKGLRVIFYRGSAGCQTPRPPWKMPPSRLMLSPTSAGWPMTSAIRWRRCCKLPIFCRRRSSTARTRNGHKPLTLPRATPPASIGKSGKY